MKKVICYVILMSLFVVLTGCQYSENTKKAEDKIFGVWFSYNELDSMLLGGNFKDDFKTAVEECRDFGITDVFIHIRPFCDSIYPSQYFPLRQSVKEFDFDVLDFIVATCHKNNMRVHAWINPYRIRTSDNDINALPENSPARLWGSDNNTDNDSNICLFGGIYLNPASIEARRLITDGIREVIENYKIDGIHFDDYFYPTSDQNFDIMQYGLYVQRTKNPLPLYDWRRANINSFISGVSSVIRSSKREIIFSISPSASIEKNYQNFAADIKLWIENGYVDWIIPQLYFGFDYPDENFCFDRLFKEWSEMLKNSTIKFIVGLASYKIDTESETEREEWSSGMLLSREIEYANTAGGFCFFSYSSLFGNSDNQIKERENIKSIM